MPIPSLRKNSEVVATLDKADLESRILGQLGGRIRSFRILIAEDGIILQGRSATYHVKQLAQHAVMNATGISIRANDIEVS